MAHYFSALDGFLHSRRFPAMPRDGDNLPVLDMQNGNEHDTAVSVCTRRRHTTGEAKCSHKALLW